MGKRCLKESCDVKMWGGVIEHENNIFFPHNLSQGQPSTVKNNILIKLKGKYWNEIVWELFSFSKWGTALNLGCHCFMPNLTLLFECASLDVYII